MRKPPPIPRRFLEDATRRERIIECAESLFAEKGLHHTTVADIAKMAEFGIGTVYKYFRDKRALIQCLLENRLGEHYQNLNRALEQGTTPLESVERLIETYFDEVARRRNFFVMFYTHFHPGPRPDPQWESIEPNVLQKWKLTFIENVREVFAKGVREGQFSGIAPDFMAAALLGILISYFCFFEEEGTTPWDIAGMKAATKSIFLTALTFDGQSTKSVLAPTTAGE